MCQSITAKKVAREQTSGRVAPLLKFETEGVGIRLPNTTEFGFVSYFYSRGIGRCWRVAKASSWVWWA
jgi:succinate-semialdehyde dehydrogenase / glutarate-semialdehyde dehydrogenase